ncbi:Chemotaxis protein, CheC-like [Desulfonema limicola]|uniref:Chemotaxis protein, CheC-like n=1 Tax=Desulfonema limicola TaxID=45656 RepID=A0A975B372_9BACT|nr:SpoIIE family protein phosphatase [Desulfonema limicola]QTA77957.1 Chemotaxis protein, CheC-like [Desulfonema limicola]
MPAAIQKRAFENQSYCGDECAWWEDEKKITLCIVDGLGHGQEAETAARQAIDYVKQHLHKPIEEIFAGCNISIRDTRGAAMGIAIINKTEKTLTYAGIGNTRAVVLNTKPVRLSGNYGIIGGGFKKITPETIPVQDGSIVVMFTDGIEEMVDLAEFNSLLSQDMEIMAQKIIQKSRKNDDSAVMVFQTSFNRIYTTSGGRMVKITENGKDIITELINTGIGRAASALSELLNSEICLNVLSLKILNSQELIQYLEQMVSQEFVIITQKFSGGLNGEGIVSFPVTKGKTLINILLEESENPDESFNVLELEAISEVGNLVINAIGSTIADMVETELAFQLPNISISQKIITFNEDVSDKLYIIGETNFSVKEKEVEGKIILAFSYENLEMIVNKFEVF